MLLSIFCQFLSFVTILPYFRIHLVLNFLRKCDSVFCDTGEMAAGVHTMHRVV